MLSDDDVEEKKMRRLASVATAAADELMIRIDAALVSNARLSSYGVVSVLTRMFLTVMYAHWLLDAAESAPPHPSSRRCSVALRQDVKYFIFMNGHRHHSDRHQSLNPLDGRNPQNVRSNKLMR